MPLEWNESRNRKGEFNVEIKPDTVYRFVKSGNLVRTDQPTDYAGPGGWIVTRVDTGKEMIVPGRALVDPNDPDWS
jgi:flagellar basal body rod protein FlgG